MITTRTIYDLYKVEGGLLAKEQADIITASNETYKKLMRYFTNSTKDIPQYNEELLLTGNHPLIIDPVNNKERFFNVQLKALTHIRLLREQRKENQAIIKEDILTYQIFRYILHRFNTLLAKQMIHKGYVFYDVNIGKLGVHLVKNAKGIVNWGTSFKLKNKLIAEGEEPYSKKSEEEAKLKGETYNGIKWLDFTSPYQFYFYWKEDVNQRVRHPNIIQYALSLCRGDTSMVAMLTAFRASFTEEEIINLYNKNNNAN